MLLSLLRPDSPQHPQSCEVRKNVLLDLLRIRHRWHLTGAAHFQPTNPQPATFEGKFGRPPAQFDRNRQASKLLQLRDPRTELKLRDCERSVYLQMQRATVVDRGRGQGETVRREFGTLISLAVKASVCPVKEICISELRR